MKKKNGIIIAVVLAVVAAAGIGAYLYFNRDLTGMTAEEISAFKQENPKVNVRYTVTIDGGETPVELDESSVSVTLTTPAQVDDLIAKSGYLQNLATIDLGSTSVTSAQIDGLMTAFPYAESIVYSHLNVLGELISADTEELDLSAIDSSQVDEAIGDSKHLTNLKTIELLDKDGNAKLAVNDALALHAAYPDVHIRYALDLFGQRVTTDAEELIYDHVEIGDAGVAEIRKLLPLMDKLTYLKLDDCGTTDDTMAQLRADFPNIQVHWRIFFSNFNVMTDNYKLWAGGLLNRDLGPLVHLRGTKYLDIGHHNITNIDFCANLPDLEVGIFAIGPLEDISGIKNCTKLEYLELLVNPKLDDEDMQNLSGLVNLEHLNIGGCRKITNLSFTDNMTKLKRFHCTMSNIPQEEIDRFIALHPDCEVNFSKYTDPIEGGWRYNLGGKGIFDARYLLLREQIGYLVQDVSRYPLGELKEEITYESTGITPED